MTRQQTATVLRLMSDERVRGQERDYIVNLDTLRAVELSDAQNEYLASIATTYPVGGRKRLRAY